MGPILVVAVISWNVPGMQVFLMRMDQQDCVDWIDWVDWQQFACLFTVQALLFVVCGACLPACLPGRLPGKLAGKPAHPEVFKQAPWFVTQ
jgi:hypothetical protein